MGRYLVVANQTLGCDELVARLDALRAEPPCSVHLLVPVTPAEGEHQWDYPPTEDRMNPDAASIARALADDRLAYELARLRPLGVEAAGTVVLEDPVEEARRLLAETPFDAVIICTLPHRLSRWLVLDLPRRLTRAAPLGSSASRARPAPRCDTRPAHRPPASGQDHRIRGHHEGAGADEVVPLGQVHAQVTRARSRSPSVCTPVAQTGVPAALARSSSSLAPFEPASSSPGTRSSATSRRSRSGRSASSASAPGGGPPR